jgi:alpha-tubulin suppressor-like RCC1 family protein
VAGWGSNTVGELGNRTTADQAVPVLVAADGVLAGGRIKRISSSYSSTLALRTDGTLAAWGVNEYGQLGNGGKVNPSEPVAVVTTGVLAGKTVAAVATGSSHSLALCADGTLAAWGQGGYGQLGDNRGADSAVPILVSRDGVLAGKTVVAMATGWRHSLALCSDGTVAAWGANDYGQLGFGTQTDSLAPVRVDRSGVLAGKTVTAIAAGGRLSLALCSDGTLAAWGDNTYGQFGSGSSCRQDGGPTGDHRLSHSGLVRGRHDGGLGQQFGWHFGQ